MARFRRKAPSAPAAPGVRLDVPRGHGDGKREAERSYRALGPSTREAKPAANLLDRGTATSLTAAATQFKVKDPLAALLVAQTRQVWQTMAYAYYSTVGEIHYAARFVGNCVSRVRLVAARKPSLDVSNPQNDGDAPTLLTGGDIAVAVRNLKSPRGGQAGLLRMMAINLFLAGECFLIGTEGTDGMQQWDSCSINELVFLGTDAYRRQAPALPPLLIDSNALVIRVWSEHPEFSLLADSSIRSCMDECEKLLLLSRQDRSLVRSRFAGNGILFVPAELMPPAVRDSENPTEDNPFMQKLTEALMSSLIDELDTSSLVPILLSGPAEYGKAIQYITFDRPVNARAAAMRQESIGRIATAVDLPSEILTGKADLNHWTAWQINEDTVRAHLQPLIELICDALTMGYLQPALKNAGYEDWNQYVVWYDSSNLTQAPDRSEKAQAVFDRGGLSKVALRRENGFNEADAPSQDEYYEWVGVQLQDESAARGGPMQPKTAPGGAAAGGSAAPTEVQERRTQAEGKDVAGTTAITPGPPQEKRPGKAETPKPGDVRQAAGQARMARRDSRGAKPITAAGARRRARAPLGRRLARIDQSAFGALRNASARYMDLRRAHGGASKAVTAAANGPGDQFQKNAARILSAAGLAAIHAAAVEIADRTGDDPARVEQRLVARYGAQFADNTQQAVAALRSRLDQAVDDATAPADPDEEPVGETDDVPAKPSWIRSALLIAGGGLALGYGSNRGSTDDSMIAPAGGSGALGGGPVPGAGVATGSIVGGALANAGIVPVGYIWDYGLDARARSFESHEALDGYQFQSWDDDGLSLNPGDEWIDGDHYAPGDHDGCLCAVVLDFGDESGAGDEEPLDEGDLEE